MHEALFYNRLGDDRVRCRLCPHECTINNGKLGSCQVRKNENAILYTENYGKVCSIRLDPIEKKPLYHFYPGSLILSIGTVGCNLHCKFCQNHEISQVSPEDYPYLKNYTPEDIVVLAKDYEDNAGIAYTYNEPTIWYEFMLDTAKLAQEKGLKNVAVTNGFINEKPLQELLPFIDAFNVDLKAFNEDFYTKNTSARLEPVKQTILNIKKAGKHLEITNLVITGLNDDESAFEKMVSWISSETGRETPLHISRYFPVYKMDNKATSVKTLQRFYEIASGQLDHVYLGNISTHEGQNTSCSSCGKTVIERNGYSTYKTGLTSAGHCKYCGHPLISFI